MKPGTAAHRDLFCRTFIDTHVGFEPETLPWPELDPLSLERLRNFPLWSYARGIEQRAGRMVTAFAETLDDPLIREAVALQGLEETRHGRLMAHVVERYGIEVAELTIPEPPARREDWLIFGFGECTDSFIGFGAFALARQKQLFPESLMRIFDTVLFEEARHITFFVNWWRYEEARAGRDGLLRRSIQSLKYHAKAIMGTAQGQPGGPKLPEISKEQLRAILDGFAPAAFLETALAENRRHMAKLDPRLIQPKLMPTLATLALIALKLLPPLPENAAATNPAQDAEEIRSLSAA
ncbi:MAG TPA: hypothetical protein VGN14_10535 [Candidatus Elarobacter sp.]